MTIKDAIRAAAGSIENPQKWAIRLSLFAAAIAIWVKSGGPVTGYEQILFALAIGMAALVFEYIGAKKMTNAYFDRSLAGLVGWALIWAGAFLYSSNNWLGVAAEGENAKATAQKASFVSYQDSRTDLDSARARLKAAEATVAEIKAMTWQAMPKVGKDTVMSVDAAQVIIDASKEGTKRWQEATRAKADLAERAKWQGKLETAEREVAAARGDMQDKAKVASTTKATTSDARADLRVYVKYLHMTQETAEDVQSWLKIGVISLFVTLAAVMGVIEQRKDEPRRPWIRWRTALAHVRSAWDGKGIERVEITRTVIAPSGHAAAYGK